VVADVILADADGVSSENIREEILRRCRTSLAPHKVPAVIRFVPSLEITTAGKLARHDA
jgi:acyl-coenzyme A synthetase/AMP-(fatty) acid ligase